MDTINEKVTHLSICRGNKVENSLCSQNAVDTTKKSRQKLNFEPVRLAAFEQELLEALDEPLVLSPLPSKQENEKINDDAKEKLLSPAVPITIHPKPVASIFGTPLKLTAEHDYGNFKLQCNTNINFQFKTPLRLSNSMNQKLSDSTLNQFALKPRNDYKNNPLEFSCLTTASTASTISLHREQDNKENESISLNQSAQNSSQQRFNENIISVNSVDYIVLNLLGNGGSSFVYNCYNSSTKAQVAIKKVDLGKNQALKSALMKEVVTLRKLQNCTQVIKLFDYQIISSENVLVMVMEKGGPDLKQILKDLPKSDQHLPLHKLMSFWMDMLYAVKEIHENGVIHADLKPANFVLIKYQLKLIDFGISVNVSSENKFIVKNERIGSIYYMSPEAVDNNPSMNENSPSFGREKYKLSYQSDVWSLGCILYQLIYKRPPLYQYGTACEILSALLKKDIKINYADQKWVPPIIIDTMKKCLVRNAQERPSIHELIKIFENIYF